MAGYNQDGIATWRSWTSQLRIEFLDARKTVGTTGASDPLEKDQVSGGLVLEDDSVEWRLAENSADP